MITLIQIPRIHLSGFLRIKKDYKNYRTIKRFPLSTDFETRVVRARTIRERSLVMQTTGRVICSGQNKWGALYVETLAAYINAYACRQMAAYINVYVNFRGDHLGQEPRPSLGQLIFQFEFSPKGIVRTPLHRVNFEW